MCPDCLRLRFTMVAAARGREALTFTRIAAALGADLLPLCYPGACRSLPISTNPLILWWAHEGSNLGPAD
ncbi:hypothetical protein DF3PB_90001 [uncultured Defluviicoccus sp.]|uniref:Uncharacterized protein n=1 Tax=metagenome TaxID=256318 RepID=A0A380TM27_9ZZZZ|nr:hypothetical protein DF3PB_90001 [uncultured Defluviicoccus sp.]